MFTLFNLQGTLASISAFVSDLIDRSPSATFLNFSTPFSVCQELFSKFFKLFGVVCVLASGLERSDIITDSEAKVNTFFCFFPNFFRAFPEAQPVVLKPAKYPKISCFHREQLHPESKVQRRK